MATPYGNGGAATNYTVSEPESEIEMEPVPPDYQDNHQTLMERRIIEAYMMLREQNMPKQDAIRLMQQQCGSPEIEGMILATCQDLP